MKTLRPVDRRRHTRSSDQWRFGFVVVLLLLLEFYVRPAILDAPHGMPDFLVLLLLLLAIRVSPGVGAVVGLLIGLVMDVLTPAHFGAGMLASVLVGAGAAWGRSLFFADNLLVNAALFFIGTWVRNVLMLVFSATPFRELPVDVLAWAPLQSLTTAIAGVIVVVMFRDWLAIRIER